ncbi:MAG TPA: GAF domain-containing protein, partial [Chloroflexota bacterium]
MKQGGEKNVESGDLNTGDLRQQASRLETLNQISRVLASTLDLQALYATIYEQVGRLMDTSQFFIALYQPDCGVIRAPYLQEEGILYRDQEFALEGSTTGAVIADRVPFRFDTPEEFHQFERDHGLQSGIIGQEDSESGIFVPLNTGSRTIGAMTVQSKRPHAYSDDDVQTLLVIAAQAAVAIENARLYQQSQESVRQMEALLGAAQAITSSLELQRVLEAILQSMREVAPYFIAAVLMPNYAERYLEIVGSAGFRAAERRKRIRVPFGKGVTGKAFETGDMIYAPDVPEFPDYVGDGFPVGSEVALPLKRGEVVVGVLDVEREESEAFSGEDLDLLSLFASQAAIAIENA